MWTLNIWLWLLLYPSVTRKVLQTLDCIELLGEFDGADPAVHCSGDVWWFMAVLASVGVRHVHPRTYALVTQMAPTLTLPSPDRNLHPNSKLNPNSTSNPEPRPNPSLYPSSTLLE